MKRIELSDLPNHVGLELGSSPWIDIEQSRINAFAEVTGDPQWIHVDAQRAAQGREQLGQLVVAVRRHAGEQRVTVAACVKAFPKPIELQAAVATDGDDQTLFVLEELLADSEGSSPEGSGGKSEATGPSSPASTDSTPGTSVDLPASPSPSLPPTATPFGS